MGISTCSCNFFIFWLLILVIDLKTQHYSNYLHSIHLHIFQSEEVRSNGGEETLHNVTVSSSVGDITIDSIKDHLGSGEDLNRRISGICVTKTVTTIVNSNTTQEGTVTESSTTTTTTTTAADDENSEYRFFVLFSTLYCFCYYM